MSTQKEICTYLENNKNEHVSDTNTAKDIMRRDKKEFLIGDEAQCPTISSAKYFKISYSEGRKDEFWVQFAPVVCFRSGYLKIDSDGAISLTDEEFKPYRSSKIFYFKEGKLEYKDDGKIMNEERLSSKCIKGFAALGVFAVGGNALYDEAVYNEAVTSENELNLSRTTPSL